MTTGAYVDGLAGQTIEQTLGLFMAAVCVVVAVWIIHRGMADGGDE